MSTVLDTGQVATFHVGDGYFGIDVLTVREVVRVHEMTTVPLAARDIRGVINLRGEIVTAIDLRRRFGLPDADELTQFNLVVRQRDNVVSLLVDSVEDVISVDPTRVEPAPPTLRGPLRDMIIGVHRLDGRLLQILDVDRVVAVGATGSEV